MTTVFIAGSISISRLHEKVQERISKIVSTGLNVVVGDAEGADTSIQQCLYNCGATKVTVYCTGDTARNNVAGWPVHQVQSKARAGSRSYFTAKDLEMARSSDYGLMIWDCKSTGTLSNVIELLKKQKKSVVFVNKKKDFVTVSDKVGLNYLIKFMSDHARAKAEEKIGLSGKISEIDQEQFALPISGGVKASLMREERVDDNAGAAANNAVQTANMKLRSELISALREYIDRAHLSQSQAAEAFGVNQPRISDLTRGKIDLFGLDTLVNMATAAGLRVEMRVRDTA